MTSKVGHGTPSTNRAAVVERTLFAGYKVPDEISKMAKLLKKIDHSNYRKIIIGESKEYLFIVEKYQKISQLLLNEQYFSRA